MYTDNMKVLNRLANQVYAANSVGAVASFPEVITVAVSSVCNYRCLMCAEWRKPQREELSPEIIEKLEDVLPFVSTLYVTGGEPLLYPHLDRLLATASRHGCSLQLVTNGALLDAKRAVTLLGHGLEKLKFSLDAVRPATYKKIRGGDLNKVLDNLRHAVALRNASGLPGPYVEVGFVAMRSNIDELPKFVFMARKLGVDVIYVSYMAAHHADAFDESLFFDQARSDKLMIMAARVAREIGVTLNLPPLFQGNEAAEGLESFRSARELCHEPWRSMFLWPDGSVSMCCGGGGGCGSLADGSFTAMWNHPARVQARTKVNTDNPPKACASCFTNKQQPNRLETHFTDAALRQRAEELGKELPVA
uniref:Putative Fe-S oxidoreductase n=1 Tax=Desulfovibrio sp. U5L TaxID=596152 RepID=I2Q7J2_9BACT